MNIEEYRDAFNSEVVESANYINLKYLLLLQGMFYYFVLFNVLLLLEFIQDLNNL